MADLPTSLSSPTALTMAKKNVKLANKVSSFHFFTLCADSSQAGRPKLLASLSKAHPPSSSSSPLLSATLPDDSYTPLSTHLIDPRADSCVHTTSTVTLDLQHGHALPPALQSWIFALFETNMKPLCARISVSL